VLLADLQQSMHSMHNFGRGVCDCVGRTWLSLRRAKLAKLSNIAALLAVGDVDEGMGGHFDLALLSWARLTFARARSVRSCEEQRRHGCRLTEQQSADIHLAGEAGTCVPAISHQLFLLRDCALSILPWRQSCALAGCSLSSDRCPCNLTCHVRTCCCCPPPPGVATPRRPLSSQRPEPGLSVHHTHVRQWSARPEIGRLPPSLSLSLSHLSLTTPHEKKPS
jgi:hypothetical protein